MNNFQFNESKCFFLNLEAQPKLQKVTNTGYIWNRASDGKDNKSRTIFVF